MFICLQCYGITVAAITGKRSKRWIMALGSDCLFAVLWDNCCSNYWETFKKVDNGSGIRLFVCSAMG